MRKMAKIEGSKLGDAKLSLQRLGICNILGNRKDFSKNGNKYMITEDENRYKISSEKNTYFIEKSIISNLTFEKVLSKKFDISLIRYYILEENNDHEGETWFFYGSYSVRKHTQEEWESLFKKMEIPDSWILNSYNLTKSELKKFIGLSNTSYMNTYNQGTDLKYRDVYEFNVCETCCGEEWYKGEYEIECNCKKIGYFDCYMGIENENWFKYSYDYNKIPLFKWVNLLKNVNEKLKKIDKCVWDIIEYITDLGDIVPIKEIKYEEVNEFLECKSCDTSKWTKETIFQCLCKK